MPTVWPTFILIAASVLTLVPASIALVARHRQVRRLRGLAAVHGCEYRPRDEGGELARRLGPHLPTLAAAAVRVRDVFTSPAAPAGDGRRLVLRVDYTLGSVRSRRNVTRVVAFEVSPAGGTVRVGVASEGGSLTERFEQLLP